MDEPAEKVVSIATMFKAYDILAEYGYERFRRYVVACNMSTQDIERCINKHKYNTEPEFKAEIDKKIKDIKNKLGVELNHDPINHSGLGHSLAGIMGLN